MSSLWWSRRAIVLHCALALAVPAFLAMGFWQLHRALSGNLLSWAYTFEWPFFAGYATWMWWMLLHDEDDVPAASGVAHSAADADAAATTGAPKDGYDPYDERDPELAAYNRYLAELNASDKPKRW